MTLRLSMIAVLLASCAAVATDSGELADAGSRGDVVVTAPDTGRDEISDTGGDTDTGGAADTAEDCHSITKEYDYDTYCWDYGLSTWENWTWVYDAGERLMNARGISNGVPIGYDYAYDGSGFLVTVEYDYGIDGALEWRETHTNDAAGRPVLVEVDLAGNGSVDDSYTYAYDSAGNILAYEVDYGADGGVDFRAQYAYDRVGNLVLYEADDEGDGAVDTRIEYTYDNEGHLLLEEIGGGTEGQAPIVTYTYTYDSDGYRATYASHSATADALCRYTYDALGLEVTMDEEIYRDGVLAWASHETYAYDSSSSPVLWEFDEDVDSDLDADEVWIYDAEGRVVSDIHRVFGCLSERAAYTYDDAVTCN